jgi:hypothetical protein
MDDKRKTVGQIVSELLINESTETSFPTPAEANEEKFRKFEQALLLCIERGKKLFDGDFYIDVASKKERSLQGKAYRDYFIPKGACPTPQYDQTVYRYYRNDDRVEFLWVIPAKDICGFIIENALILPDEQAQLRDFVLKFTSGELDQLAMKLNGEIILG